ncbi:MAG: hypothetical protein VZR54_10310 [Ruminococcus sp.]|nr:hypothetical protein [Ruminococcus sp.]
MKTRSKAKKIIIIAVILILVIIAGLFAAFAFRLMSGDYTDASDIAGVYKVNHGSQYVVLSTEETRLQPVPWKTNDGYNYYRDVRQAVMSKSDYEFREFLRNNGCYEYDRSGALGFYKTADGKPFTLILNDSESGGLYFMPFAVIVIEGITIDDIT